MPAVFTYAAIYRAEAECRTPLRTGGTDGDPELILRDRDGRAFVQGSSLAGALRSWLETGPDRALAGALFGSQTKSGHLLVSNALFDRDADQYTRPRLHMDSATGTGVDGRKFDMAHIGAGAKLNFTLTWLGTPETAEAELPTVERALGAMNVGAVCLGGQNSNGFGQLTGLAVTKQVFDLRNAADRRAWLDGTPGGAPLALPETVQRRQVLFTLAGHSDNLLIKTAPEYYKNQEGETRSYTPSLYEGTRTILPASSIKGAVRSRCTYIARMLGLGEEITQRYFGRESRPGDNGLPGRIRFEDALLEKAEGKISRIRVDRFTGGVFRGGLFTEEPVSSNVTLRITAPDEPEICALLLYALRDLALGLYNLGSGWAIGRGQVAVRSIQVAAPDGRTAALRSSSPGQLALDDPSGLFQGWLEELEKEAHHES